MQAWNWSPPFNDVNEGKWWSFFDKLMELLPNLCASLGNSRNQTHIIIHMMLAIPTTAQKRKRNLGTLKWTLMILLLLLPLVLPFSLKLLKVYGNNWMDGFSTKSTNYGFPGINLTIFLDALSWGDPECNLNKIRYAQLIFFWVRNFPWFSRYGGNHWGFLIHHMQEPRVQLKLWIFLHQDAFLGCLTNSWNILCDIGLEGNAQRP